MQLRTRTWYRPAEVADYLAVSARTVYRLADEGEFVCARFRGSLRIRADSIQEYIHKQTQLHALDVGRD